MNPASKSRTFGRYVGGRPTDSKKPYVTGCNCEGSIVPIPWLMQRLICFQVLLFWSGLPQETIALGLSSIRGQKATPRIWYPFAWLGTSTAVSRPMTTTEIASDDRFSMPKGILGAFLGAAIGVGAMFGFYSLAGFRFPLLGVGIGALTGYFARLLYKGTHSTLGLISGGIALASVVGTLYLMYGEFPLMNIISVIVSVSVAYRLAAHS